jgi:hypothetical protein
MAREQLARGTLKKLHLKEPDMAAQRIVLNLAIAVGVLAVPASVAADEYRGTMEQQMACTPDVFRLCGAQIPDVNRIVGCLRHNTAQLSGPCRAVFESNNSVPQPQPMAPGRRAYPPPPNSYRGYPPPPDSYDDDNQ